MKNFILIVLLIISNVVVSQDFENSNWNDSKEKVVLNNPDVEWLDEFSGVINIISEFVTYKTTFNDQECFATYYFVENTLQMGTYIMLEEHYEYDSYNKDYKSLKKHLKKQYGKANRSGMYSSKYCLSKKQLKRADAVAMGFVSHYAEYNDSNIYLEMTGKNGSVSITLLYISPGIDDLIYDITNNRVMKY